MFTHGYAVVVGVGYDLPATVRDARALAELLHNPGRCAYPQNQVQLLTEQQATRQHVLAALETLAQQTSRDPDSTAVVFFSGHGINKPAFHLMPYGYDVHDLAGTAISEDAFTERLRAVQAKKLLVLIDSCHAGGQGDVKAVPELQNVPKAPLPTRAVEALKESHGRVFIASSRADEVSYTGVPYSTFTGALLEGFAGYGAFEKDGYARIMDIAMYVSRMVPNRQQDRQHPIIKLSNLRDNFAVAYYAGGDAQPKKLDWASVVPQVSAGIDQRRVEAWLRMLASQRENLLLMEERMYEYINFEDIPLQLVKNKRRTEDNIADLEGKLGIHHS